MQISLPVKFGMTGKITKNLPSAKSFPLYNILECPEIVAHVHVYVIVIRNFGKIYHTSAQGMYLYEGGVISFPGFFHLTASDRNLSRALQQWAHD